MNEITEKQNNGGINLEKIVEGNTLTLKFDFGNMADRQAIEQKIEDKLLRRKNSNGAEFVGMTGSYSFCYKRYTYFLEVKLMHTEFVKETKTQKEIEEMAINYVAEHFEIADLIVNKVIKV